MIQRLVVSIILFVLLILIPLFAVAQITCLNLGQIAECQGPNQSYTQVPFSKNQGVIITDHDTMPYMLIQPVRPQRELFYPTPLPSLTPPHQPTSSELYQQLLAPTGAGLYGEIMGR